MSDFRSPLTDHLSAFVDLTPADRELLHAAVSRNVHTLAARQDIISDGDRPRAVNVVLEGWAMRYKQLSDGRRQILAFLIPGDLCDANVFILKRMDHSLAALTALRYAEIAQADFEDMMAASPRIAKALWWSELVTVSIQREWTTNIGQRSAYERIAHLFCEIFARQQAMGFAPADSCELPLTQLELGDATGLTSVHVNRTLQQLRKERMIELRGRRLQLLDPERLREVAMFSSSYLHLDRVRTPAR
ncbi:MAG TPA: Crp/Fnr family transcriptional regulator [Croceibacterium sp.]|nr:Crp/Fnr family transcriptional regulator [Croceibacterium sp.]